MKPRLNCFPSGFMPIRVLKLHPFLKYTSTRRTRGHCLGTIKIGEKMFLLSPLICSVSHYLPPRSLLSLYLFSEKRKALTLQRVNEYNLYFNNKFILKLKQQQRTKCIIFWGITPVVS
jgi:hypothetical protein